MMKACLDDLPYLFSASYMTSRNTSMNFIHYYTSFIFVKT